MFMTVAYVQAVQETAGLTQAPNGFKTERHFPARSSADVTTQIIQMYKNSTNVHVVQVYFEGDQLQWENIFVLVLTWLT